MKYFTLVWWSNYDDGEAFRDSEARMKEILPKLPEQLQRFHREASLHDARLRLQHLDVATQILRLNLENYEGNVELIYGGERTIQSTADPDQGLAGPHGYGDLGYDEIDLIEDGLFEHRMLFSSGIELQVQFSRFSFKCIPKQTDV